MHPPVLADHLNFPLPLLFQLIGVTHPVLSGDKINVAIHHRDGVAGTHTHAVTTTTIIINHPKSPRRVTREDASDGPPQHRTTQVL